LILQNQVPITQSCHSHQSQSTQSSKHETGESQQVSRKTKWNTTHRQNLVTHIQQILISCSRILGFLWYDTLFVSTRPMPTRTISWFYIIFRLSPQKHKIKGWLYL